MIKRLVKKWKVILGYLFYSGGINTCKLKELYEMLIKKVKETGFKVLFTVCDQDGVHRSLFKTLCMSKDNLTYNVDGEKVHFFYDSSQLLRSLRNTFLKYNIRTGGNIISWEHIKHLYLTDNAQKFRLAPKLTFRHMCEEGFSKNAGQSCHTSFESYGSSRHLYTFHHRPAPTGSCSYS